MGKNLNVTNDMITEGGKLSNIEGDLYWAVKNRDGYSSSELASKLGYEISDVYEPLCSLKDAGFIKAVFNNGIVRYFFNRDSEFVVKEKTNILEKRIHEIDFVGVRNFCNIVSKTTGVTFSEKKVFNLKEQTDDVKSIINSVPDGVAVIETFVVNKETKMSEPNIALVCVCDKKLVGHILGVKQ